MRERVERREVALLGLDLGQPDSFERAAYWTKAQ